jgi:hypothetical protein
MTESCLPSAISLADARRSPPGPARERGRHREGEQQCASSRGPRPHATRLASFGSAHRRFPCSAGVPGARRLLLLSAQRVELWHPRRSSPGRATRPPATVAAPSSLPVGTPGFASRLALPAAGPRAPRDAGGSLRAARWFAAFCPSIQDLRSSRPAPSSPALPAGILLLALPTLRLLLREISLLISHGSPGPLLRLALAAAARPALAAAGVLLLRIRLRVLLLLSAWLCCEPASALALSASALASDPASAGSCCCCCSRASSRAFATSRLSLAFSSVGSRRWRRRRTTACSRDAFACSATASLPGFAEAELRVAEVVEARCWSVTRLSSPAEGLRPRRLPAR